MSGDVVLGEPDYYARKMEIIDGFATFKTKEDERSESEVSKLLEVAWKCECYSFGWFSPIDWYFVRGDKMVGIGELKTRTHSSSLYPTVYLNVRKYSSLMLAPRFKVPGLFVVRFTDCIRWINVLKIDASDVEIGGCKRIVKSRNDIEPVIEVPISDMKELGHRVPK